jgi:hypothetical protein
MGSIGSNVYISKGENSVSFAFYLNNEMHMRPYSKSQAIFSREVGLSVQIFKKITMKEMMKTAMRLFS